MLKSADFHTISLGFDNDHESLKNNERKNNKFRFRKQKVSL